MASIPKILEEFHDLRDNADIQSVKDFYSNLNGGTVSWQLELGTILSLINFDYENSILDAHSHDSDTFGFEQGVVIGRLQERYGFSLDKPICFLQTFTEPQFADFVKKWHTEHGEQKHWNPSYARKELAVTKPVTAFCKKNSLEKVVHEFNIPGIIYREEHKESRKYLSYPSFEKKEPIYLVFPVDGWSLAHCIQLSYERNGKKK